MRAWWRRWRLRRELRKLEDAGLPWMQVYSPVVITGLDEIVADGAALFDANDLIWSSATAASAPPTLEDIQLAYEKAYAPPVRPWRQVVAEDFPDLDTPLYWRLYNAEGWDLSEAEDDCAA